MKRSRGAAPAASAVASASMPSPPTPVAKRLKVVGKAAEPSAGSAGATDPREPFWWIGSQRGSEYILFKEPETALKALAELQQTAGAEQLEKMVFAQNSPELVSATAKPGWTPLTLRFAPAHAWHSHSLWVRPDATPQHLVNHVSDFASMHPSTVMVLDGQTAEPLGEKHLRRLGQADSADSYCLLPTRIVVAMPTFK